MTRKDFEAVAEALGKTIHYMGFDPFEAQTMAAKFSQGIRHTNPRFNEDLFINAVIATYNK